MQSMTHTNRINLFNNFEGYVDHVLLCPSQTTIAQKKVKVDKKKKDCILNLGFSQDSFNNVLFKNTGVFPSISLDQSGPPKFDQVFY